MRIKRFLIVTFLSLQIFTSFGQWITLEKPEQGIVGKLIINGIIQSNPVDTSQIISEDGADTYLKESKRSFDVNLKLTRFSNMKYSNVTINHMKIDILSDSALYNNPRYQTNVFVYKALRADSMEISFKKTSVFYLKPSELLNSSITNKIKTIIPVFDSLGISFQSNDSIVLVIKNPKVYFQAVAIKLKDTHCDDCRISFASAFGETVNESDTFNMNLADLSTSFSNVYLAVGTQPSFKLSIAQDRANHSLLKLLLALDPGFLKSNGNRLPAVIEVPYDEVYLDNKTIRRYGFPEFEHYLGSILTTDKKNILGGTVYLNIPVFISISGQQMDDTRIKFLNFDKQGTLQTKLEYQVFSSVNYDGDIQ